MLPKSRRLNLILHLLYRNSHGLTAKDLARQCGVSKRTAQRDLHDLEEMGVPVWQSDGSLPRYGITAGYYLPPIHLNLDDAIALYLAARLLAGYADAYGPHIIEALAKLANILPESIARYVHATISFLATREGDESFARALSVLGLGWATGTKVHIRYQVAGSENVHDYLFSPYFIEPSAVRTATYAIGYASDSDALRAFEVERILSAELTDEHYKIPEDFDGPRLLRSASSIWSGEGTQEVVLRFCADAAGRVKETCWHPSQRVEDLPDGGCILRVYLAEPTEILYWVRCWGPQVEVIEPVAMRERLAAEAAATAKLYGVQAG
jgi:predicted DNA-binding transcriptional regulator YafY